MPQTEIAYLVNIKYLFKTGYDSYVMGTIEKIHDDEIMLRSASLQIPPAKIDKFMAQGQDIKDVPIHAQMILPRVNIDWAVRVR